MTRSSPFSFLYGFIGLKPRVVPPENNRKRNSDRMKNQNFVSTGFKAMFVRTPLERALNDTPSHLIAGVVDAEIELMKIHMGFSPNTPDEVING